jgi:hypothetical protein
VTNFVTVATPKFHNSESEPGMTLIKQPVGVARKFSNWSKNRHVVAPNYRSARKRSAFAHTTKPPNVLVLVLLNWPAIV